MKTGFLDLRRFKPRMNPPSLVRADDEPDGKLNGEEDDDKVVEKLDDENHPREFNISRLILQIC